MITITYFGNLKQLQPSGSETLQWLSGTSDDLLDLLRQRGPDWADALQPGRIFKIAINQQLQHGTAAINDGDQVAILPPVTGG
ncbi:MoaD/ThiS family protein [Lampropedia aestuarii]|uniref:MoaD/ThiS family protein n=1 Tax=Lampropedia aestuarii TaxID=2562762 RepID=A0A4S5BPT2_9BURK|nr:MoaD/ThiS family protein [Lampropedia aestuarii]MDH5856395.1 MoaD/ThiS family protein [Lampropedia aestuarii]THJ31788.1 MoaD/ThiS family protein [Lampropedia aestuarii]